MPFNIKAPGSEGGGGGRSFFKQSKALLSSPNLTSLVVKIGGKVFPVFSCFSLHAFGVETCSREDTSSLNKHIDG